MQINMPVNYPFKQLICQVFCQIAVSLLCSVCAQLFSVGNCHSHVSMSVHGLGDVFGLGVAVNWKNHDSRKSSQCWGPGLLVLL